MGCVNLQNEGIQGKFEHDIVEIHGLAILARLIKIDTVHNINFLHKDTLDTMNMCFSFAISL